MDFSLTAEQEQMQSAADTFIEGEGGVELARRQMEGEHDVVDEIWAELAAQDYLALTVPVEHGGLGDGLLDLSLFLEVAGRYALPGPIAETLGFAVPLIEELGSQHQRDTHLPAIADGEHRATMALYDDGTDVLPAAIQLGAERTDSGFRLDGTKTLVPYADVVDTIIVPARTENTPGYGGITLFLVDRDDVEVQPLETFDRTRPLYDVTLDGVTVSEDAVLGPVHGGGSALERGIDRLNVARAAILTGGADAAVDRSVDYASEREQFGYQIGRFQAVKHRIVDMWTDMEATRSLTYYAAWAMENDRPDARQAVSEATQYSTERCTDLFSDDLFNHGATGFTWETDSHIFLKQAKSWESLLGSPSDHRERIADAMFASRGHDDSTDIGPD